MYVGRIEKLLAYYTAIPMCIVNTQGKITRASKKIVDVFIYDGIIGADIFALTGIKIQDIIAAAEDDRAMVALFSIKTIKNAPRAKITI